MPVPSFLTTGALDDMVALGSLVAMTIGAVDLARRGRWSGRLLLIAGAIVWPVPDHPLQGRVLIELSYLHGIHTADLLSLVALALALTWPAGRGHASTTTKSTSRLEDQRPVR